MNSFFRSIALMFVLVLSFGANAQDSTTQNTNFNKMNDADYSLTSVQYFADSIRAGVIKGEYTWQELGFTDSQVEERLHSAKVRAAAEKFSKMNDTAYSLFTVQNFADDIRAGITKGEFSWSELSFNDKQIEERLHQAKVRDARDKFSKCCRSISMMWM